MASIKGLTQGQAYDADDRVIIPLKAANIEPVIPPKANRKDQRDYDEELYKSRHLIEKFFSTLLQPDTINALHRKTQAIFLGAIYLAASLIWLN